MAHRARTHESPARRASGRDRPASDIRAIRARTRRLVIDIGLEGDQAQAAWVTVTDPDGATCFEGTPSADGQVVVWLDARAGIEWLRILIETATSHRQTEIVLKK